MLNKERIITASIILCFVVTTLTYAQTVEDYFNSGLAKAELQDYRCISTGRWGKLRVIELPITR